MMLDFSKPFLYATDVDGTLINNRGGIEKENKELLGELLKNRNCKFVIATGRPFSDMKEIMSLIPSTSKYHVLAANSSHIYSISPQNSIQDIEIVYLENSILLYSLLKKICCNPTFASNNKITMPFLNLNMGDEKVLKDLLKQDKIIKFAGALKKQYETSASFKTIIDLFKNKKLTYYVHKSNRFHFIEITHFSANKVLGIRKIAKLLDIDTNQVFVVGDGINDYEMLSFYKHSFCMNNHNIKKILPKHIYKLKSNNCQPFLKEILSVLNYF